MAHSSVAECYRISLNCSSTTTSMQTRSRCSRILVHEGLTGSALSLQRQTSVQQWISRRRKRSM